VDSTGIKVEGEGEWNARKHGGPKRRVWRKIHLGIDEQTMGVRAVEIIASRIGNASVVADPRDQITADRKIGSVMADGAHDTRKCHDATAERAAPAAPRTRNTETREVADLRKVSNSFSPVAPNHQAGRTADLNETAVRDPARSRFQDRGQRRSSKNP